MKKPLPTHSVSISMTPAEMGRKGGLSRSARMTPEERSEAARKASKARWAKKRKKR